MLHDIQPGTVIESRFTSRQFVVETYTDGYYKCRPVNTLAGDDFYYIPANRIIKYWDASEMNERR